MQEKNEYLDILTALGNEKGIAWEKGQGWKDNKMASRYLSESYRRLGIESKAVRVRCCAEDLYFKPKSEGGMKLCGGYFCQVPLCPVCAARRTQKIFGQVSRIMNYMEQNENYRYIFLTLTVRNVKGVALRGAIDGLMAGFNLLTKHVKFKNMSEGWFRALEITHNWVRDDYHPHFHMVIAVDEKYFNRKKNYLTHEDWKKEWQNCMGLDYTPSVYVQRVRKVQEQLNTGDMKYWKAVAEISKYSTKSNDYMVFWKDRRAFERKTKIKINSKEQCYYLTDMAVSILDEAIHNRRLISFGGGFKDSHKILNLSDPEDIGLVKMDDLDEEMRMDLSDIILHYKWRVGIGDYVLVRNDGVY